MTNTLFEPIKLGRIALSNRIVMAPMTRSRADTNDCPTTLHVKYYSQRASAGLIITEGVQPSKAGKGYCRTPGIYNHDQVSAWKNVTTAVHDKGGKIVMQIMHCGRVGAATNKDPGIEAVAPSAIKCNDEIFTEHGMQPMMEPRALSLEEIADVVNEYRLATANAYEAGFDGVELHCTSGYLPAQFLSTGTNQRNDAYGGSLDNRLRFVLEVLAAMNSVDGPDRVGIRICPANPFNDLQDANPEQTFTALLKKIDGMGLAYLHVIRMAHGPVDNLTLARKYFSGPLMINDSYTKDEATAAINTGEGDVVSFARPFISNPDLVERFKYAGNLASMDPKTLYTPGEKGFTDYPPM